MLATPPRVLAAALAAAIATAACSAPEISRSRVIRSGPSATPDEDAGPPLSARAAPLAPLILPLPMTVAAPDAPPTATRPAGPTLVGQLNLNTAAAAELMLLPGIGEKKAARILDWRTRRPFTRVKDLRRVKGFGRKTLQRLERYLIIAGPNTLRYEP